MALMKIPFESLGKVIADEIADRAKERQQMVDDVKDILEHVKKTDSYGSIVHDELEEWLIKYDTEGED